MGSNPLGKRMKKLTKKELKKKARETNQMIEDIVNEKPVEAIVFIKKKGKWINVNKEMSKRIR